MARLLEPSNTHEGFGELRALLHGDRVDLDAWRVDEMLEEVRARDDRLHSDVWLPYARSALSSWDPIVHAQVPSEQAHSRLLRAMRVAPSARFDVVASARDGLLGEDVSAFIESPAYAQVVRFEAIEFDFGEPFLRALAKTPYAGQLRCLALYRDSHYWNDVDSEVAFLTSDNASRLRELDLSMPLALPASLHTSCRLNVSTLHLNGCGLSGGVMESFARMECLSSVRTLGLGMNGVSLEELSDLAGCVWVSDVRHLELWRNPIHDWDLHPLTHGRDSALTSLETLDLSDTQLTSESMHPLLAAPRLPLVRHLDVSNTMMQGAFVGRRGDTSPRLRSLNLWSCGLTASDLHDMSGTESLSMLEELTIGSNPIGPSLADALSRPVLAFKGLRCLNARGCGLTDASMKKLAKANFERIEVLKLSDDTLTLDGVRALTRSRWFDGLETLELEGVNWSEDVVDQARADPALARVLTIAPSSMMTRGRCDG